MTTSVIALVKTQSRFVVPRHYEIPFVDSFQLNPTNNIHRVISLDKKAWPMRKPIFQNPDLLKKEIEKSGQVFNENSAVILFPIFVPFRTKFNNRPEPILPFSIKHNL